MATVLYAIFEPSMDRVTLSTAGHLPPIVASPSDGAALIQMPVDLPVGVSVGPPRRSTVIDLPLGGLLFLYTDGLVERRGRSLDVGLELLSEAVTLDEVETVCTTVLGRLVGSDHVADDVAMLVARRLPTEQVVPLDVVLPAAPRSLSEVRAAMRRWLNAADAPPEVTADLLVATSEACSNVVEHAYGPGGGTVTVHAGLEGGEVIVIVRDNGQWRSARGEGRGRGTTLMRQCCDDVDVSAGVAGTTVTLRRRLERGAV
jgi:anti-sigma regulatory factor (Ser/Thr protein kinase)